MFQFLTDLMYTRCTDRFARILANHSVPTYEYLFEYRGQYSIVNLQGEQVDMGIAHGDELQYIFSDIWGDDLSMSPSDTKFSKNIFTPLLTNFAKTRFLILLFIYMFLKPFCDSQFMHWIVLLEYSS